MDGRWSFGTLVVPWMVDGTLVVTMDDRWVLEP